MERRHAIGKPDQNLCRILEAAILAAQLCLCQVEASLIVRTAIVSSGTAVDAVYISGNILGLNPAAGYIRCRAVKLQNLPANIKGRLFLIELLINLSYQIIINCVSYLRHQRWIHTIGIINQQNDLNFILVQLSSVSTRDVQRQIVIILFRIVLDVLLFAYFLLSSNIAFALRPLRIQSNLIAAGAVHRGCHSSIFTILENMLCGRIHRNLVICRKSSSASICRCIPPIEVVTGSYRFDVRLSSIHNGIMYCGIV